MFSSCNTYRDELARFIEGTLDADKRANLEEHALVCEGCREELDWATTLAGDLEALGDALVRSCTEIDVLSQVMEKLKNVDAPKTIAFTAPKARRKIPLGLLSLAAAAVGVFFVWLGSDIRVQDDGSSAPPVVSSRPQQDPATQTTNATNDPSLLPSDPDLRVASVPALRDMDSVLPTFGTGPNGEPLTSASVYATYRAAFKDEDALRRLIGLAYLSDEDAGAIAGDDAQALATRLGAAEYLDDSEKRLESLRSVVGHMPDDPYAQFRLAQATESYAGAGANAEELASLEELDPDNALTHYLRGRAFLYAEPPDVESALAAFELAGQLDEATAYALDAAEYRSEALIAGGMDASVARLLGAVTAGRWEYAELTGIAEDLMSIGRLFEDQSDLNTAIGIYESVLTMGQQITDGASLSQERLAGMDVQKSAIEALEPIYDALGQDEDIANLAGLAEGLVQGLTSLGNFFEELDAALDFNLPEDIGSAIFDAITDFIFVEGDFDLAEFIRGLF